LSEKGVGGDMGKKFALKNLTDLLHRSDMCIWGYMPVAVIVKYKLQAVVA
jgi:hypothetical protein